MCCIVAHRYISVLPCFSFKKHFWQIALPSRAASYQMHPERHIHTEITAAAGL